MTVAGALQHHLGRKVTQATQVIPVHQDCVDFLDTLGLLVPKELMDHLALMDCKAILGWLVVMVQLAFKASRVIWEISLHHSQSKGQRDLKDFLDFQAALDCLERKEQLDRGDHLVNQVQQD